VHGHDQPVETRRQQLQVGEHRKNRADPAADRGERGERANAPPAVRLGLDAGVGQGLAVAAAHECRDRPEDHRQRERGNTCDRRRHQPTDALQAG
jgi:hypothetical protein